MEDTIICLDFHDLWIALCPCWSNLQFRDFPQVALTDHFSLVLVAKQVILLKFGAGSFAASKMLRKDAAGQIGRVGPGEVAADVCCAVRRVERPAHSSHQAIDDFGLALDDRVVHANLVEGPEVHNHIVCHSRGAELVRPFVQRADESDNGVDSRFAVRETSCVGHRGGFVWVRMWSWCLLDFRLVSFLRVFNDGIDTRVQRRKSEESVSSVLYD